MGGRVQGALLKSSAVRKAVGLLVAGACAFAVAGVVAQPAQAYAEEGAFISVYEQTGNQAATLTKSFTKTEFEALKSDGSPISALYYKGNTWNVSTAATYVTLNDLLEDAGAAWASGDTITWGGDATQGKASNAFTYDQIAQLKFFPNTASSDTSTEGATLTGMVLSITEMSSSVSTTAADAVETNVANATDKNEPRTVLGSLTDEYLAASGTSIMGKRLWNQTDMLLITHKGDLSKCTIATIANQLFTGEAIEPELTVTDGDVALEEGVDYTVEYANNVELGTATATITGMGNYEGELSAEFKIVSGEVETQAMFRLYNPNSGEHFYTSSESERDNLESLGWNFEGTGWIAPEKSSTPVYRLYNPNAGEHHYTISESERDMLVAAGWNFEGIGWYSDDAQGVAVHRAYNPNAFSCNHNYTTSEKEQAGLVKAGWTDEGTAWYGVSAA